MGLNSKAVSAEGRGHSGPVAHPAHCTQFADGEGTIEILDGEVGVGKKLAVSQAKLWQWAVGASLQPKKLTGEQVVIKATDRCYVALMPGSDEAQSVQVVRRFTGKIFSRPSPQVGQIQPDEQFQSVAGSKIFVKVSEVAGALQLPAVGEYVEFQLGPNPERADRLWAASVTLKNKSSIAMTPLTRTASGVGAPSPKAAAPGGTEALPPARPSVVSVGGAPPGGGGLSPSAASPALPQRPFQPGRRLYLGCLPETATWRELQAPPNHQGRRRVAGRGGAGRGGAGR